ncbi:MULTISPECIES: hydroxymethylglutaryl-CoA lyase [Aliiglaciecola]|uniref:hydroxymethylglutaryl-CoA lyase n=1 Tax=Aliiglaciecola TaxID=1406885 RepID=UPI001C096670|nr:MULTISPECIES: hydroxymethylglutaryl-CoA lyase [Aliiglaciecola]MBU2879033.1 hydroxymethylglutaryl-CoA lyase [Aliiglaciecola lipolytica]MDO6710731.1 hydroxymethylglutaryl-CoA lyase [Aliiglaciecola sp. 2_MG-2023]MDO6751861.1 hydroxymethylglutaryl-CoA lyase [Aliiglaciecola sp. 1_MG-2023]
MNPDIDVEISEVGPRDGLQSIKPIMSTNDKKRWVSALAAAGIPEIEVGSFVPASILPQLADTAEIVAHARTIPGLNVAVLVPNYRGAQDAIKAGAHKITIPLSVSETHSLKNVRRTHAQVIQEVAKIRELINQSDNPQKPILEGGLSTAFGCTLEGNVPESKVFEMAEKLIEAGCDEVGLSDTTGFGTPNQVKRLTLGIWELVGKDRLTGIHLHNTRGQGLANVMTALEVGLKTIDSSMAGIGGCPFAPGASGNIITEDLVFLLEGMGLKTGINYQRLLLARKILRDSLPVEVDLYGFTPEAGLPKGFQMATAQY